MAEKTGISWCDSSFNPWTGCVKRSPACQFCYAEAMINRFGGDFAKVRKVTSEQNWKQPLKWNRLGAAKDDQPETHICRKCLSRYFCESGASPRCDWKCEIVPYRPRVFCASLADVFEDWQGPMHNHKGQELYRAWHHAQPDWVASDFPAEGEPLTMQDVRYRLFELIDSTMNLDWLVLTKRPENIRKMWRGWQGDLLDWRSEANPKYRDNVWLGTTVENQEYADKRIPELMRCCDLSPVLFLSVEPMLGPINLSKWLGGEGDESEESRGDCVCSDTAGVDGNSRGRIGVEDCVSQKMPLERSGINSASESPSESGCSGGGGLQNSESYGGQLPDDVLSASTGVVSSLWKNSSDDADQSQEWNQERQQTGELRGCDSIAKPEACSQNRVGGSVWGTESSLQDQQFASGRDPQGVCKPSCDAGGASGSVRSESSNDFAYSARGSSEATVGSDCGLHSKPESIGYGQKRKGTIRFVIAGCESGPQRRKTELDWVRSLRDQCQAAGTALFVKQLEVDGKVTDNIEDFPEDLRIQEFPSATQPIESKQTSPRST